MALVSKPLTLHIVRFKEGKDFTLGKFELKDSSVRLRGYTLEPSGADEIRPNLDKRIPKGEYKASFEYSPRYKTLLPVIYNEVVSKSRRILIHAGNTGDDTSGCILLGKEARESSVVRSKECLGEFLKIVGFKDFKIRIDDGYKS